MSASLAAAPAAPAAGPFDGRRVVLVAAHPDDEVLGAGGQFAAMRALTRVFLTDGASSQREAWRRGWATRGRYARARLAEAQAAAALAGAAGEMICLGARDRAAALDMAGLAQRLAAILAARRPDCVLTQPYEGGHADHDAAALVARLACRAAPDAALWEMTSYHATPAGAPASGAVMGVRITAGAFRQAQPGERRIALDAPARARKQRMLDCFASQAAALAALGACPPEERFRPAAPCDFRAPPHDGALLYEQQAWSRMTGRRWRSLAAAAERRWCGLASQKGDR